MYRYNRPLYCLEGMEGKEGNILNSRIPENHTPDCRMVHGSSGILAVVVDAHVLEPPLVTLRTLNESWGVVALIEVLEHAG